MEKSRDRCSSSSIATVEEIRRRLVRPSSSLQSQSSTSIIKPRNDLVSCELNLNSTEESQRKLEDYLDPVLLSVIRKKIGGGKRKIDGDMKFAKRELELELEFEWPVDELKKVFTEGLMMRRSTSTEIGIKRRMSEKGAVDLNNDHIDSIEGVSVWDDDEEVFCTPFQRTALKRFRKSEG